MIKTLYKLIGSCLRYVILLCVCSPLLSQNIKIRGQAHQSYAGKQIDLYTNADFITGFRIKESSDTIDAKGFFELPLQSEITQPVFIKIGNVVSELFVQPDFVYGITIPELDSDKNLNPDVELYVNIGVLGHDSTELNALIFDYQEQYNRLFTKDDQYLSRAVMFRRCDSLQKSCDKRYAGINNPYFKNYVQYSIASVNASLSRGEKFLMAGYIQNKPIQHRHHTYMSFFRAYFQGYLARIASQRKGQSLYSIINTKADYATLLNFVRYEKDLKTDSLRELIIISELWDYYFSPEFEPEAVGRILAQLHNETKIKEHKLITANMISFINKLQIGAPAPGFQVLGRDGKVIDFSAFKGKWVYLNFFSTKNTESLKEMMKISNLDKKFGQKMSIVSICLDDSISGYKNYLRNNPRFTWPIYYHKGKGILRSAKDAYSLTGTEGYYLISNQGYLVASPALSPSQGIEYRLNIIFRVKQRSTKTGIR